MTYTKQTNCSAYINKYDNKNVTFSFENKQEIPGKTDPRAIFLDSLSQLYTELIDFKKVVNKYFKE